MSYIDVIIRVCESYTHLGDERLPNGARLIGKLSKGHAADFHILNEGLAPGELDALELLIRRRLPTPLREFYQRINGGHFFAHELSMYGLRRSHGTSVDDSAQPFALERANVLTRPASAPPNAVLFAFYEDDGAQLAAFPDSDRIVAVPRGEWQVKRVWPDLESALASEFNRLGDFFDLQGRPKRRRMHCSPIYKL